MLDFTKKEFELYGWNTQNEQLKITKVLVDVEMSIVITEKPETDTGILFVHFHRIDIDSTKETWEQFENVEDLIDQANDYFDYGINVDK